MPRVTDIDPVDTHIGGRLRDLRAERRLTQQQLAERLGVTFQQVQKYERGVNRVAASRLHQAAVALDVTVADFLPGLSGFPSQNTALDRLASTPSGAALAIAWDALDRAERDAVLTVVLGLAGDRVPPLPRTMPEAVIAKAATASQEATH